MSGFLRPEVRALLLRWREVIVAVAVIALGLWIAARPGMIVQGFGYVVALAGLAAMIPAIRRARFARDGMGPGVVTVTERQISYLGPYYGGAVALDQLSALSLRRDDAGRAYWVLAQAAEVLVIPVNARGAEVLFDAFSALDGLEPQRLLSALNSTAPGTQRLWGGTRPLALTR